MSPTSGVSQRIGAIALGITMVTIPAAGQGAAGAAAPAPAASEWQLGAFLDVGYLNSFNSPSNHQFRTRGTTPRVDEVNLHMAGAYIKKQATESSRWGLELTGHGGEDAKLFGFSATAPNLRGSNWLRHLGPTNVTYAAPGGAGLSLQGGIFGSLIGYDSLYAKDNLTYTRPWSADFTPYLMLGVNGSYPVSETLKVTGFVVNGYWHLADANRVPSVGTQISHRAAEFLTVRETVLYGPHQENTGLRYWRFLSNTTAEWKTRRVTTALDFHVSTEAVADENRRAWWVAGQLPVQWSLGGPWDLTIRPEFAWDSRGRWTGVQQSVIALTTTVEYAARLRTSHARLRFEYRFDRSAGPHGGFFKDVAPGVVGLTPRQNLLAMGVILTVDRGR